MKRYQNLQARYTRLAAFFLLHYWGILFRMKKQEGRKRLKIFILKNFLMKFDKLLKQGKQRKSQTLQ